MKIAVLTGGGSCPGINFCLSELGRIAKTNGSITLFGIPEGWAGLLSGTFIPFPDLSFIEDTAGSVLISSRTNIKADEQEKIDTALRNLSYSQFDALIAIGGEDTLGVAKTLSDRGAPIIGIPKTLDNDLPGTEMCLGFSTVVENCTQLIRSCMDTARTHRRITVVETLGRHSGWVALHSGFAAGADIIMIPEMCYNLDQIMTQILKNKKTKNFQVIVISENINLGCKDDSELSCDSFGQVVGKDRGLAMTLAKLIEDNTGLSTRHEALGESVRGGPPGYADRIHARMFAKTAIRLAIEERFGQMTNLQDGKHSYCPLPQTGKVKYVPKSLVCKLGAGLYGTYINP